MQSAAKLKDHYAFTDEDAGRLLRLKDFMEPGPGAGRRGILPLHRRHARDPAVRREPARAREPPPRGARLVVLAALPRRLRRPLLPEPAADRLDPRPDRPQRPLRQRRHEPAARARPRADPRERRRPRRGRGLRRRVRPHPRHEPGRHDQLLPRRRAAQGPALLPARREDPARRRALLLGVEVRPRPRADGDLPRRRRAVHPRRDLPRHPPRRPRGAHRPRLAAGDLGHGRADGERDPPAARRALQDHDLPRRRARGLHPGDPDHLAPARHRSAGRLLPARGDPHDRRRLLADHPRRIAPRAARE